MSEMSIATVRPGVPPPTDGDRVLKGREVIRITGRSRTTIWRDQRAGRFPKRLILGPNSVGWLQSEIYGWLAERAGQRG